jgi:hypothetical protein
LPLQFNIVELDVSSSSLLLVVQSKYDLSLNLQEPVDPDTVTAKFTRASGGESPSLHVSMQV